LDKPAKILIGGIFAGALVYGLGEMNTFRLERKVQELQRACVSPQRNLDQSHGSRNPVKTTRTAIPSILGVAVTSFGNYVVDRSLDSERVVLRK